MGAELLKWAGWAGVVLFTCGVSLAAAQSPNTSAIVVLVVDQTGAVVPDAQVSAANAQTGSVRQRTTGRDGSVTLAALPLTGAYKISVAKTGFRTEDVPEVALRAGETASIRIKLVATGGQSEVTVYGTTQGVRRDPEIGVRLDSGRIDETPVLGQKITSLPLLNSAFRSGKGTGDLFVNATYFVAGAGGRRQPTYAIDGATGDEPWGRQTMFSTVPVGAVQEMTVLSSAFSSEFGWTSSAAINVVTKSGTNDLHGEALYVGRPGSWETSTASAGDTTVAPADVPDVLNQVSGALGGAIVKDKTFYFVAADGTAQDRTAYFASAVPPALLGGATSYTGNYRQALVDARLDHKLNPASTLMARFNLDRFSDNNPQDVVSGTSLPSAGRVFRRHTYTGQINDTMVISNAMLNEARFEFQDGDPITDFDPISPSTQFTRAGV
ncbi:MAG TPA: TonB-dependent receptor, partial [Vicinamibacterales bacterium]|nr:TonB-dependent receptor [Vicinamibacterales bacterium]